MPFSIQNLLEGRSKPVTVKRDDSVQAALDLMIEHDFNQLPVIDEHDKPLGLITSDSIVRTLNSFGVSLQDMHVFDAMVRVDIFYPEDDLFDVLDRLQQTYAVLIVNRENKLGGIITNYDSADYFRRRAEDLMLVEDIEGMLKEYIRLPFTNADDTVDEVGLQAAVDKIISSQTELSQKFRRCLLHYLGLHSQAHAKVKPDSAIIDQVIAEAFAKDSKPKSFNDLTMNEIITLFLHQDRWPRYQPAFSIEPKAIFNLLDNIRQTRNILAHFRRELTATQRDQLRVGVNWLERHQAKVREIFALPALGDTGPAAVGAKGDEDRPVDSSPILTDEPDSIVDDLGPDESRYAALAVFLQRQPPNEDNLTLTFNQIEEIIGGELPPSAYKRRAWWANDSVSHVQSQQWLAADWKAAWVTLTEQQVRFTRIKERNRLYIEFFSNLLEELKNTDSNFPLTGVPSPDGRHYFRLTHVPFESTYRRVGSLAYTFTRFQDFRIQFDINRGDQAQNKAIFDGLYQRKTAIERQFGHPLQWQRFDDNLVARITAATHPGSIDDPAEKLAELRRWGVAAMIKFEQTIRQPLLEIIDNVFGNS